MSEILNGKELAKVLLQELKEESMQLEYNDIIPTIGIIRVGDREDDIAYERGILRNCEKVNIKAKLLKLENSVTMDDFIKELKLLNEDSSIHGILIFRPLPKHLDESIIKNIIDHKKDIDCMSPLNIAKVFEGDPTGFYPCTPSSVIEIIKRYNIDVVGKKTVIIGRSMVVGKPLSMMLLKENATVTICHSKTANLKETASDADILIAAIGKAKFITGEYIKPGAIVIDVGINVDDNGKLCGDVDFDTAIDKASLITPVPNGVGSVTTAILLKNVINAAKNNI